MTTALEINEIHKAFGKHKVLDGFSLRLERGEILGLLGPKWLWQINCFEHHLPIAVARRWTDQSDGPTAQSNA